MFEVRRDNEFRRSILGTRSSIIDTEVLLALVTNTIDLDSPDDVALADRAARRRHRHNAAG